MEDEGKAGKASFEVPHANLNMVMPLMREAVVALLAATECDNVTLENNEAESNGVR
jgi:hypothetical protein